MTDTVQPQLETAQSHVDEKLAQPQLEELLLAQKATDGEHNMGLIQAVKTYPKAVAWSMAISFAVVMEGFDVILLSSFYAYPSFVKRFGVLAPNGTYQIPAHWQVALGNSAGVGGIIGLIVSCLYFYSKLTLQLNGFIAERIGYKKTMIGGLVYMLGVIFLFFFAKNLEMLLAAEILCGIPWGIFQTLTTSYASEVVPVALRGYLTTWVNACWGIGQLISLAMLRGLLQRDDDWGWRIPYALQWFWPIPLLVIAFLAPESPWWLTRKGRLEDARRSLERLTSPNQHADLDAVVAMMHHTVQLERETTAGATYLDCFRGVNLRRTELTCMSWLVQSYCGSAFMGYSTYFLQQAGLSTSTSFTFSMVQYAINTFGVFIAWFIMAAGVGRRSLYLYGCVWMFCVLIIIGGVSTIHSNGASWAVGIMLLIWSVAYQFTVGTVCYSLVTEFASRHLAIKTISLGRGMYCVAGIVNGSFMPYMLNPTAWNWGGKTAFFWAGFCLICIVWIYFRLPEPQGYTYAEISYQFEHHVSARKFHKVKPNLFENNEAMAAAAMEKDVAEVQHIDRV